MPSISYQDFQDSFIINIRNFESPHIDAAGNCDFAVGFNVLCKDNNRTMYFGKHMSSNDVVPAGGTETDVVNTAWNVLSPAIQSWASEVHGSSNLIGGLYEPSDILTAGTATDMTIGVYNSNFSTKIQRLEVYPMSKPACWCIGFNAENRNSSVTKYIDTQVNVDLFDNNKTEVELVNIAWDQVKDSIGWWAADAMKTSPLLDTEFVPTPWQR